MKKQKFNLIRQALEEHLTAINENTSEIQALFDYLQELDFKMDKLSQRLDQLQLSEEPFQKLSVSPLTHIEKKVFLVFYTEETPLSQQEIAAKANLPLPLVTECVSVLVQKGIPLQRSYFNNSLFLKLDPRFKERQAKENLLNLTLQSFIEQ